MESITSAKKRGLTALINVPSNHFYGIKARMALTSGGKQVEILSNLEFNR